MIQKQNVDQSKQLISK